MENVITWTNNSQANEPEQTKIERVEGNFGSQPLKNLTTVAEGNQDGLDPTLATGTYTDTTIEADKYYSYRVSTVKGSAIATSAASDVEWVYNAEEELGYPGGYPDEAGATNYNLDHAPVAHVDCNRIHAIEPAHEIPLSAYAGSTSTFPTEDTHPSVRVANAGEVGLSRFGKAYHGGHKNGGLSVTTLILDSGKKVKMIGCATQGNGLNAGHCVLQEGSSVLANHVTSYLVHFLGQSTLSDVNITSSIFTGMAGIPGNVSDPNNGIFAPKVINTKVDLVHGLNILVYRHNNTPEAFASTTGTKAQLFANGALSIENVTTASSYHNNAENKNYTTHCGAYSFSTNAKMLGPANNYRPNGALELLVFDKLHDVTEINTVISALSAKYDLDGTPQGALINGDDLYDV